MKFIFKNVDETNLEEVLMLTVKEEQQKHIETVYDCLFEASNCSPDEEWTCVGVYLDDTIVGFAMYGTWANRENDDKIEIWIDRFLIDEDYQGKGYGKKSFEALMCFVSHYYETDEIFLSVYEDNKVALKMYEELGFKFTGAKDAKGELVMSAKKTTNCNL